MSRHLEMLEYSWELNLIVGQKGRFFLLVVQSHITKISHLIYV
jgi:hypothetical protein